MSDALGRLRAKRAAAAAAAASEGTEMSSKPRDAKQLDGTAASSNNKRSDLKKLRENARAEESDVAADTASSKLASIRQRLANKGVKAPQKDASDDDDEDDGDDVGDVENDKNSANAQEKTQVSDDAEEASILQVDLPPHLFPLTFETQSRQAESLQQPCLALPAPYPNFNFNCNSSSASSDMLEASEVSRSMKGTVDNFEWTRVKEMLFKRQDDSSAELEKLIHREAEDEEGDIQNASKMSFDMVSSSRVFDGLHVGNPACLAFSQLRSEPLAMCGGSQGGAAVKELLLPAHAVFSRATQRLLRDLPRLRDENQVRDGGVCAGQESRQTLLRHDPSFGLLMRVPEDPVETGHVSVPLIPNASAAFGGQMGQWSERASDRDRLGPVPRSFTHSLDDGRALLTVQVRRMVLEEHPMFINEERLAVRLRFMYSQYCLLYEHGALHYLAQRLAAVTPPHCSLARHGRFWVVVLI